MVRMSNTHDAAAGQSPLSSLASAGQQGGVLALDSDGRVVLLVNAQPSFAQSAAGLAMPAGALINDPAGGLQQHLGLYHTPLQQVQDGHNMLAMLGSATMPSSTTGSLGRLSSSSSVRGTPQHSASMAVLHSTAQAGGLNVHTASTVTASPQQQHTNLAWTGPKATSSSAAASIVQSQQHSDLANAMRHLRLQGAPH
jgi:hypothetical protein